MRAIIFLYGSMFVSIVLAIVFAVLIVTPMSIALWAKILLGIAIWMGLYLVMAGASCGIALVLEYLDQKRKDKKMSIL